MLYLAGKHYLPFLGRDIILFPEKETFPKGSFPIEKAGKLGNWSKVGMPPPPLPPLRGQYFFELGTWLKWFDRPPKILWNKLNMKNIGTKSINMSETIVYLPMFSTTTDKILCFFGPHKMKMSHYFSVFDTLWNLVYFYFFDDPFPPIWTYSKGSPLFKLESFPL